MSSFVFWGTQDEDTASLALEDNGNKNRTSIEYNIL